MRRLKFPMTIVAVLLFALSAGAADNELSDEEKQAGWQLLFNGKDLTGWKCNNGKKIMAPIEDGALVPYESGGYIIIHEKPFDNFVLKCDEFDQPGVCPDGQKHKYKLNEMPRAVKDFARVGYLGFQDHGHKVWYKNVKLLKLDL